MKEKDKYILLREAEKFCNYSQSYLSLRARQGKLKAKKIKRNWVTTKEWLHDYLENVADKNNKKEVIKPPDNLPIESSESKLITPVISRPSFFTIAVFSLGLILFVLLTAFLLIPQETSLRSVFEKANIFERETIAAVGFIPTKDVQASTFEVFRNYKDWVIEGTVNHLVKIRSGEYFSLIKGEIFQRDDGPEKEIVFEKKEEPGVVETKEGMVMFPSEDKEYIEDKIKSSFSDKVEIRPTDEVSGIIVPIFKETKGQEYFYIMVPLNE